MQTDPSLTASTPGSAWTSTTSFTPASNTGSGAPAQAMAAPAARPATAGATRFVTGAYQPSGDHGIDRMIELERALKQYRTSF